MHHIDLSSVLRQTVACDLYSNLVTRPTGAAVRDQIERLLDEAHDRTLTVIDFSQVSMIDFSCADEVIAKLLLRYEAANPPREAYFLFRGVTDEHTSELQSPCNLVCRLLLDKKTPVTFEIRMQSSAPN